MKRRSFIQTGTAALALGSSGAITGAAFAQEGGTPQPGGVLRFAAGAQPPSFDPHMTTATATAQFSRNIFEQLLCLNEGYQYTPMLAESVEQSDDGMVFTFHLRQGVLFHNGKEMTAEDVIASLTKWIRYNSRAAMFEGTTMDAPDPYTVVLNMASKSYGVLETIAGAGQFSAIMPKEIVEAAPPTGVTEYIGTGPYRFVEWRQDQFIRLARFDDYVPSDAEPSGLAGHKTAYFDEIVFTFVSDTSTRLAGIMTGEYDVAADLPADYYPQIRDTPDLEPLFLVANLVLIYNKRAGLFANQTMRQAVNAAIDSEEVMIATQSFPEFYRLDSSYMYREQTDWHSTAGSEFYNMNDPERARELLAEAGYNGETVRILTSRDYEFLYTPAVVIREQLIAAGMNVQLDVYDWPTLLEHRANPEAWDIVFTGFPLVLTPNQLLYLSPNWAGWTDDETIQDYLAQINQANSLEEATAAWQALQGYCWEYLPVTKLGDRMNYNTYNTRIVGMRDLIGPVLWNAGFAG